MKSLSKTLWIAAYSVAMSPSRPGNENMPENEQTSDGKHEGLPYSPVKGKDSDDPTYPTINIHFQYEPDAVKEQSEFLKDQKKFEDSFNKFQDHVQENLSEILYLNSKLNQRAEIEFAKNEANRHIKKMFDDPATAEVRWLNSPALNNSAKIIQDKINAQEKLELNLRKKKKLSAKTILKTTR